MREPPVIVTGLGCVCAAGGDLDTTMASLEACRRTAAPAPFRTDLDRHYPVFAVSEPLVLPEGLAISRSEFDSAPRSAQLALVAAVEALTHAGFDVAGLRGARIGVCLGATVGCTLNDEPFYAAFKRGERPSPAPITRYINGHPARFVARALGLRGPAMLVTNACSSGADAIGIARDWVESGLCEIALTGGSDELSRIPYLGFASLLNMSDEPCRPFDRARKGLNLGEGAGVMLTESRASAHKRGARALASITGYGSCCDAHHPTAPHPEGRGLGGAIHSALTQARIEPREIGFVSAHGTATAENDRVEGRVLANLFGPDVPLIATKAYTGHTLGAAGAIQAVIAVRSLLDRRLAATPGCADPDPDCGVKPLTKSIECDARAALSTSLAFGGNNAALIFGREPQ